MSLPPQRIEDLRREPTSALVCRPFLDTDEPGERDLANQVLAERGYGRTAVRALRALALVGLWYQVFLWEDAHLDLSDVLAGYGLLAGACGVLAFLLSWVWGVGLLSLGAALLLLAGIGWARHGRRHEGGGDAT